MGHLLPRTDDELRNVLQEANRNRTRLKAKPSIGKILLRADPRASESTRGILNNRTSRDTQDTRISPNATSSDGTQDDTEQQTFPTQATLIRNCCQHGTGFPHGQHEKTRRWCKKYDRIIYTKTKYPIRKTSVILPHPRMGEIIQDNINAFHHEQRADGTPARTHARAPPQKRPIKATEYPPHYDYTQLRE